MSKKEPDIMRAIQEEIKEAEEPRVFSIKSEDLRERVF